LPKTAFTETQFIPLWNEYVEKLEKDGVRNLATIMKIDIPKIKDHRIQLIFPNEMMKSELMKMRHKLLRHFRSVLNNHSIDFDITVNEEVSTKFAYTPEEKYNKLLEKNKALAELKKRFKLDL